MTSLGRPWPTYLFCLSFILSSGCVERLNTSPEVEPIDAEVLEDAGATMGTVDARPSEPDGAVEPAMPSMGIFLNEIECRDVEWIEVFNAGDMAVDLEGWSIADQRNPEDEFLLIEEYVIEPGEFWISPLDTELPFGIGCNGDGLFLRNADGNVVDAIETGDAPRGLTWGRLPDGVGNWQNTRSTPGAPNAAPLTEALRLNEVDCQGRDRVEILNITEGPADLTGWRLTDDAEDPDRGFVLDGTVEPGEFVVVRQQTQDDIGFTFGIACGAETITLIRPDGTIEDQLSMERTPGAFTYGRLPDGDGEWMATEPTIGNPNRAPAGDTAPPFDVTEVLEIDLTVDEAGIQSLRDEPREYVPAVFEVRGVTAEPLQIGLRIKGRIGSLRSIDEKPAWKLKFDFIDDDQRFMNLERMTLNNMVQDASQIHEWAAYKLFRTQGLPSPRTGYAFVRLNGEIYGVYLNIETPDENMLGRWFSGTTHYYEGAYGQDLLGNRIEDLEVDQGDPTDRSDLYTLQQMLDELPAAQFYNATADLIDWDLVVGTMATEIYIGHWDGYAPTRNNYYFHFDEQGAVSLLPWGTDQTFDRELDFFSGRGRLLEACMANGMCRFTFEEALVNVMETVDSIELATGMAELAEVLVPWQDLDERSNRNPQQTANQVQRSIDFLERRAAGAVAALGCLLGENPDPDGDGFLCSADCDNDDPDISPGAPEICEDGIDQDCNGIIDDGDDCPDCVPLMAGAHQYLVCSDARTYAEAEAHCAENNSQLVIIQSEAENNWVRRMARQIHPANYWLGMTDTAEEGVWLWPDGSNANDFLNWVGNEPNGRENENCAQLFANGGAWIDISCDARLSVVCEEPCPLPADRDGDGHLACAGDCDDNDVNRSPDVEEICYDGIDNNCDGNQDELEQCRCTSRVRDGRVYLFCRNDRVEWAQANEMCADLGAQLITITDATENAWLLEQSNAVGADNWWMGMNDTEEEGDFRWIDGTPVEYTHWNQGEPNDWRSGEDCAMFLGNGFWNDARCSNRAPFICEFNDEEAEPAPR